MTAPSKNRSMQLCICGFLCTFLATPMAQAQHREAGMLSCDIEAQGTFVVATNTLQCTFESSSGHTEIYTGTVRKFGFEFGPENKTRVQWKVLAPVGNVAKGGLDGEYESYSDDFAIGVGIGPDALSGGKDGVIILQLYHGQLESRFTFTLGAGTIQLSSM